MRRREFIAVLGGAAAAWPLAARAQQTRVYRIGALFVSNADVESFDGVARRIAQIWVCRRREFCFLNILKRFVANRFGAF